MSRLIDIAKATKELHRRTEENPLAYFRPTPPQEAFLKDNRSKIKLLIGGNQIGKTVSACVLLIYHALGIHPYLNVGVTKESWLVTYSHEQSRTIQQKLYDLIPKSELHEECEFVTGKGFRGLAPVVRFKNGSIIRIKTCNQGIGLESGTCGLVVIDEPVPIDVFSALVARTLRGGKNGTRGTVAITMTPVGEDVSYLKKLVEEGKVSMTVGRLNVSDTTPKGLDPILTEEQINGIISSFLPMQREQRVNGAWESGFFEGVVFQNFDLSMVSSAPVPRDALEKLEFTIGIDHGSEPNSQVAIISAIDMRDIHEPRVYILGEYVGGQAPAEHHARAILELLKNLGIKPEQCTWTGDGEHQKNRESKRMSNVMLMRAFENILRYPPRGLPWTIRTVKKGAGSVYFSASTIHAIMSRRHFWIRPECQKTIESIQRWTLKRTQAERSRNPFGHCIDACRYGIVTTITKHRPIEIPKIRIY